MGRLLGVIFFVGSPYPDRRESVKNPEPQTPVAPPRFVTERLEFLKRENATGKNAAEGDAMKFDKERAFEWIGTFGFPRPAGSEGERRAAEIVAAELERLDFRVERRPVAGSRLPAMVEPWLGWVGLGAWATGLVAATHLGAGWPVLAILAVGALLWLRLTTVEGFRPGKGRAWGGSVATTNVVAWREVEPAPPVRVVFVTPLDTFDPKNALVPAWLATPVIGLILAGLIFVELTTPRNLLGLPRWSGLILLIVLWLAIAGRVWLLVHHRGEPGHRDNRSGLAALLELARVWPRGTDPEIEPRFVATGGRELDRAGARALFRALSSEWSARPTLVVEWLAPGIGPGLALMEQGTGQLADKAATDLWVPHHVIHHAGIHREHWPFGCHGPGYVGMVGNAIGRSKDVAGGVDLDALARTAQLATEVALRWAKKKQVPSETR
jgi:hypothetical protein